MTLELHEDENEPGNEQMSEEDLQKLVEGLRERVEELEEKQERINNKRIEKLFEEIDHLRGETQILGLNQQMIIADAVDSDEIRNAAWTNMRDNFSDETFAEIKETFERQGWMGK